MNNDRDKNVSVSLRNLMGAERASVLCPFHNEKTPSLSIDFGKGDGGKHPWHCFGCSSDGIASIESTLIKDSDGLSLNIRLLKAPPSKS